MSKRETVSRREFLRWTAAAGGVVWVGSAGRALGAPKQARPNIIFILADDLGYGDLGCYGQKQIRTPNIDKLAAEGMKFTDCYAGSTVCAPSRCCLMTGLHTGHALVRGNARVPLRPEDVTVAELLTQAGYATALIGKWGLGEEATTGIPTRQGFDTFFGTPLHNGFTRTVNPKSFKTQLMRGNDVIAFQIFEPDEREMDFVDFTRFRDLEDGAVLAADPLLIQAEYRRQFDRHQLMLKEHCLAHAVDQVVLPVAEEYDEVIGDYLRRRAALMS